MKRSIASSRSAGTARAGLQILPLKNRRGPAFPLSRWDLTRCSGIISKFQRPICTWFPPTTSENRPSSMESAILRNPLRSKRNRSWAQKKNGWHWNLNFSIKYAEKWPAKINGSRKPQDLLHRLMSSRVWGKYRKSMPMSARRSQTAMKSTSWMEGTLSLNKRSRMKTLCPMISTWMRVSSRF